MTCVLCPGVLANDRERDTGICDSCVGVFDTEGFA